MECGPHDSRARPSGLPADSRRLLSIPAAAEAATPKPYRAIERGLKRLAAEPAGPPGAVATFRRDGHTTVVSVGRANLQTGGLALFRYRTRCGTVYGHTGSSFGYAQWTAATADGTAR